MLITHVCLPSLKRWRLTRSLSIEAHPPHGGNARFRVRNGGFWSISEVTLYLSIEFEEADVSACPQPSNPNEHWLNPHIKPGHFVPLDLDQICWSIKTPTNNPPAVTIFSEEGQFFSPFRVCGDEIIVPTEEGWPPEAKHTRVILRKKNYDGMLKIVSADTTARYFGFAIRPTESNLASIWPMDRPCQCCV